MTDQEKADLAEIVQTFLESERLCLQDIRNKYQYDTVKMEMLIHKAREVVRKQHGIDFCPIKGFGDHVHRATPDQIVNRSQRGRRAGLKKLTRAQQRMELAATKSVVPEEKARRERAAAHQATQLLNAKVRSRRNPTP